MRPVDVTIRARECADGGDDYYDVTVLAVIGETTVCGVMSLEIDGSPARGAVDVSEWAGPAFASLPSDKIHAVRCAVARRMNSSARRSA